MCRQIVFKNMEDRNKHITMLSEKEIKEVRDFVTEYLDGTDANPKLVNDIVIDRIVKYITEDCYGAFFKMQNWVYAQEQELRDGFSDFEWVEDNNFEEEDIELTNDAIMECFLSLWFETLRKNI